MIRDLRFVQCMLRREGCSQMMIFRTTCLVVLGILLFITSAMAEKYKYDSFLSDKEPIEYVQIAGEVLAGSLAGAGASVTSLWLLMRDAQDQDINNIIDDALLWFIAIHPVTCSLFSAIPVYLIGNIGNQKGSFLATLAGSAIGVGIGYLPLLFSDSDVGGQILFFFTSSAIFATLVFNLTCKYESSSVSGTALINLDDGEIQFNIPMVSFRMFPDTRVVLPFLSGRF